MSEIHSGTSVTLATILNAAISNSDIAYIWHGSYKRKMVFDSTSTDATDTTNHPYKVRPSDYVNPGTLGVWIEDMGADQPQVWNANQVKGISGTSLEILDGGDITVNAGGDVYMKSSVSDASILQFAIPAGNSVDFELVKATNYFRIHPGSDGSGYFTLGREILGEGTNAFWGIFSQARNRSMHFVVDSADVAYLDIYNPASGPYCELHATDGTDTCTLKAQTDNVEIETSSAVGKQALLITQNDDNEPFIRFDGTSEAGSGKNVSTWTAGNSVQKFIRINIMGTDYWMPVYDAPTS